jgi:rare lipoprotein A
MQSSRSLIWTAICGLVLAAGAAVSQGKPAHTSSAHSVTGTVVYYSDKMNGKTLAMKGEKYDSNALTAASHSTFPFGSTIKVTNLSNQKSVSVKVNDRMNPKSKSVVDLSRKQPNKSTWSMWAMPASKWSL